MQGEDPTPPRSTQFCLLLMATLTVMAGAIITSSLPLIAEHFSAEGEWIKIGTPQLLTIPALFILLTSPVAGWLLDRYGGRRILPFSLFLYALSGSAGLFVESFFFLMVSRAFLGIAVAGILTATLYYSTHLFHGRARTKFLSLHAAFMGFGGVAYLFLGGVLAELSWRAPFGIYLVSLFFILPAVFMLRRNRHVGNKKASSREEGEKKVPWLLAACGYAAALVGMMVFYLLPTFMPFYLYQDLDIESPVAIGSALALVNAGAATMALFYPFLHRFLSYSLLYAVSFLLMGLGVFLLGHAESYSDVLVATASFGFGYGLLMPNSSSWISSIAPKAWAGRLLGWLSSSFFLGQFLAPPLAYGVLDDFSRGYAPLFTDAAFVAWICSSFFLGAYLTHILKGKKQ